MLKGRVSGATESAVWGGVLAWLHHAIFAHARSKGWTGSVRRITIELQRAQGVSAAGNLGSR